MTNEQIVENAGTCTAGACQCAEQNKDSHKAHTCGNGCAHREEERKNDDGAK